MSAPGAPSKGIPAVAMIILGVGSTLAIAGAAVYPMNATVGFYLVLSSTLVAHFGSYMGWSS